MSRHMSNSTRRGQPSNSTRRTQTSNSTALMAISKAIRSEGEYRSAMKKINANAMVLAETLSISGQIEQALLDSTAMTTPSSKATTASEGLPSQDRVSRRVANEEEERRQNEMFLDEQRVRLKALVAKNIGSERNVDAFVEAVNMVKTEVENRQKRRRTDGDDGESEGEGEDVAPNYEDMIQNKMKAVKRHQDQNGLDLKDEQLMRKFRERLNEKDDQADEDEDLEVMNQPGGADSENALKCQITLKRFVKPYRNKVCQHVYEYDAIINHLRSSRQCPITGCINNTMAMAQLEEDEEMQMKVRRKNRREVEEKQALDRDRDEEEESNDEGDNFGTTVID